MPVTAKLSKRFYDVPGEDVANELVDWFNAVDLTYRADLRELNSLPRAERGDMHSLRADLLRWMFGFWISTVLTLGGLMVALRGP